MGFLSNKYDVTIRINARNLEDAGRKAIEMMKGKGTLISVEIPKTRIE